MLTHTHQLHLYPSVRKPRHLLIHTHHLQLYPSVTAAKHLLSLTDTYTHTQRLATVYQCYSTKTHAHPHPPPTVSQCYSTKTPAHTPLATVSQCYGTKTPAHTHSHTTCNRIPVLWHQDTCSHTPLRHQDTCSHTPLATVYQCYGTKTPAHSPLATVSQCYITKTLALTHTHTTCNCIPVLRHQDTCLHTHTQPCRPLHSLCSALKPGAQCQVRHSWLPDTAARRSPWTGLQSPVRGRPRWTVAWAPRRTQWRHWTRLVSSALSSLARPHPAGTSNKMAQGHTQTSALQFCKRLIMSFEGGGGAFQERTFLTYLSFVTVTSSLAIWGWFGNNLSLTMEQQYTVSESICKQDSQLGWKKMSKWHQCSSNRPYSHNYCWSKV